MVGTPRLYSETEISKEQPFTGSQGRGRLQNDHRYPVIVPVQITVPP